MSGEAVARIDLVEFGHAGVSCGLREDRGGRDGGDPGVALHDGGGGSGQPLGRAVAVDEDELGPDAEPLNGALHGEHRRLKDVQRVDLVDVSPGDAPGERALANERRERLAPRGRELLRVVEALDGTVGIKNHGRRADGARERAAARLVDPCDERR